MHALKEKTLPHTHTTYINQQNASTYYFSLLALDINPSVFQALQYVREDERYDSKKA